MQLLPYREAEDAAAWDEFVAAAPMSTLLHTRRYLGYHGERFRDASLMLRDERGRLVGVFPAAVDRADGRRVTSHPGVTYGGMVHAGRLSGESMVEALKAVCDFYAGQGFSTLRYKAVPYIYHRTPAGDDTYALFRLDARRYRCDLSSAIDLASRPAPSERRRRGLKKAERAGVRVEWGAQFIAPLWETLSDNLRRKHGVSPVHTVEEIALLHSLFPREIEFVAASEGGQLVAGVVLFSNARVMHAQYIAASERGYEVSALDAVFEHCIERARSRAGVRYFDFGNSNEDEGRRLNTGLHGFKTEFGAGGVGHEFYELNLEDANRR